MTEVVDPKRKFSQVPDATSTAISGRLLGIKICKSFKVFNNSFFHILFVYFFQIGQFSRENESINRLKRFSFIGFGEWPISFQKYFIQRHF